MRPALHSCLVALVLAACGRGRGSTLPANTPDAAALADPYPPRPGPGEADQALLLRLRRELRLPLTIAEAVRSGDAWLVAYTYDINDAWWREVQREGKTAEIRATLSKRRRQCDAVYRTPAEDEAHAPASEPPDPHFHVDRENAMDVRSCWELALASLVPRPGPLTGRCNALEIVRVTTDAIDPLWSLKNGCVADPAAFELLDVAGAGWPQLVIQVGERVWDSTRMGFQEAETIDRLIVLDPRPRQDPHMLEVRLGSERLVDAAFRFTGSHGHVIFAPGKHVTEYQQEWSAFEACEQDAAGWAVEEDSTRSEADEDQDAPCSAEWHVTRRPWNAKFGRWSEPGKDLLAPTRPPERAHGLPIDLSEFAGPQE